MMEIIITHQLTYTSQKVIITLTRVCLFIFSRKHQGFVAAIEKELAALIVSAQNVSW